MLTTHPASLVKTHAKPVLLAGLTLGYLVNDFYTMILPPLIPALVPVFGLSYVQIGLLSLCFSILSGLLQPTIGHLSDKHARRKQAIIAGFLLTSVGLLAMGLAPTYPLVLVASLFCGLGAATFHPQSTHLLSRAFPATIGRAMGIHGWGARWAISWPLQWFLPWCPWWDGARV